MAIIKSIKAKKILDSRGKETLEIEAQANGLSVKTGVPSGASKGKDEAKTIDILQAIKNVNEIIGPELVGQDPTEQKKIDDFLIELDGTNDKSGLGANAIVGISMAVCRVGAIAKNISLYQHIREIGNWKLEIGNLKLPLAAFNIINGGAHSRNDLDIQEFMIVPQFEKFSDNFQGAKEIYNKLKKIVEERFDVFEIGDEGGFAPPISSTQEALDLIRQAAGETKIILDCAANHFQQGEKYILEGKELDRNELLNFYKNLYLKYPIIALEDPFGENDWTGFQEIFKLLGDKITIIGDDLLATNPEKIKEAAKNSACNGAIIKINQIGTVSEAIEAVKLAKSFSWKIIVSHRSGETLDDFIADFSVGVGADFIKSGAPAFPERLTKYNRLLQIEKEITS